MFPCCSTLKSRGIPALPQTVCAICAGHTHHMETQGHGRGNSRAVSEEGEFLYGIKTFYSVYCMLILQCILYVDFTVYTLFGFARTESLY